ncbi:DNA translocase FtsK 4TM domain-containing protein [Proteinivorax hydrogeniformans]|uniref:DNA translocase FtsK 4TM domain-containing protein n=1 Tax=Proteinivorax hydrogeniformans TaxID=1826727 RepID=A0AAU8HNQ7_9FIRM
MSPKRKRKRKNKKIFEKEIYAVILATFSGLAVASLLVPNQVGQIGLFVHNTLVTLAGKTSVVIPLFLFIYSIKLMFKDDSSLKLTGRLLGSLILFFCFLLSAHIMAAEGMEEYSFKNLWDIGIQGEGGGILGAILASIFLQGFGYIGTLITVISFMVIGVVLLIDISISSILKKAFEFFKRSLVYFVKVIANISKNTVESFKSYLSSSKKDDELSAVDDIEEETENYMDDGIYDESYTIEDYEQPQSADSDDSAIDIDDAPTATTKDGSVVISFPQSERKTKSTPTVKKSMTEDKSVQAPIKPYKLPTLDILQKAIRLKENSKKVDIQQQGKRLIETLNSFGVKAKITHIHRGPTITRFELQPSVGVKVSKILNLSDDLALNLASADIRIEAPIPGKSAIGIEVPNTSKTTVYLREVLECEEFENSSSKLSIGLGKDISGQPIIADFKQMPHLLVAGATGAGKSVCINSLIASILFKAKPDEVKFLMIDPKVVELNVYNGIPHLLSPVVTDPKNASYALKKMVKEMEDRYAKFASLNVKDIAKYNAHSKTDEDEKMPYIFVIIDELADLMMVASNEVEDCICRLAQKARAAGIHLVVATQRPSVDVITGIIKANITSRIAFAVSSGADSRTILDAGGAEKLLGKGDMLFYPVGASKPLRAQSSYIDDEEVEKLVEFVKENQQPTYDEKFEVSSEEVQKSEELDDLFNDAAELVVENQQASISLLQRRFRIGYNRAARIIDDLEKMGIVGGFEGSKAREVLISKNNLEKILN